ncbi:MAG: DedA family protein [Bacteroidales bacterium]|jgi:membrane protein DedA with SNARE-associated domain
MPEEVVYYVTRYGYLAIFILVFLQETGMPNPFPNELLLMFSGYLSFRGLLILPFVILTAVSADIIGTSLLYFLFYTTGSFITQKKPKWVPLSSGMIARLTTKISRGGQMSMYIFRVTPFTRGYTSVIAGMLHIRPKVFMPVALISAITWATFYAVIGNLIGPSWNLFTQNIDSFKYFMITGLAVVFCTVLLVSFSGKGESVKCKKEQV